MLQSFHDQFDGVFLTKGPTFDDFSKHFKGDHQATLNKLMESNIIRCNMDKSFKKDGLFIEFTNPAYGRRDSSQPYKLAFTHTALDVFEANL